MNKLFVLKSCALLHDIGKLECWAKEKPWSDHIHYTYDMVKDCFGEEYAYTSMRHHTGRSYSSKYFPKSEVEKVICLADNLASGADRHEKPRKGTRRPKPPLHLTHILSDGRKSLKKANAADLMYAAEELRRRLREIGKDFDKDPSGTYLKIYNFLESYERLHWIPADTRPPINDVSLWQHLKLTAAFATCIWLDGGYRGDDLEKYKFGLLSGDADRVSQYIGISSRLPDLYARSTRIKKATSDAGFAIEENLGPECLIYAAGGSILALCPKKKAKSLARQVKETFEKSTDGEVTITVNVVVGKGRLAQKDFGCFWKRARRELQKSKLKRPLLFPKPVEEAEVCDVCHIRPATKKDPLKILPIDASPRPEALCDVCWQLRQEGKGTRLDEIMKKTNFVAILKADGDSMAEVLGGARLEEFGKEPTPSRLAAVSQLIHEACEEDLKNVVEDFGGECLFAGGDDVLAVLPGERALEASLNIASTFRDKMNQKCTMSAGIALFHRKFPVYVGLEAADTLIHMAKDEEKKDSVAFAMIGGAGLTPDKLKNTVQPYSWDNLEKVLDTAEFLEESGLPTNQIRRISGAARKDPQEAEMWIKYLMGRESIPWSKGNELMSYLKSGLLSDAFMIYNSLKARG